MEVKKRKLSEIFSNFECCVCGESGSTGFTNIYNISLREKDDFLMSFVEVVSFVLGIEVLRESSDICVACKPKIIEYYHFKKRSQSIQKKISPLLQEIMKIVNNFITKNDIKAITIEESREKLVLMEKLPQTTSQDDNLLDIEIKREPDDGTNQDIFVNELDTSSMIEPNIKEEIDQIEIKTEPLEVNDDDFHEPTTSQDIQTETLNTDLKIDQILKLNRDIFAMITTIDLKFDELKSKAQNSGNVPYLLNQDAIRPLRK